MKITPNITVTNTNDAGTGSLRDAIALAKSAGGADTIQFDSTTFNSSTITIALTSTELLIDDANAVTIDGTLTGSASPTISTSKGIRLFDINKSAASVTINALKITGGNPGAVGGGILIQNADSVTINNCLITKNTAAGSAISGGAIYAGAGSLTLSTSTISANSAGGSAGGIYGSAIKLTMDSCTVNGNTANVGDGGAIYGISATVTLTKSTIENNRAFGDGNGGGIFAYDCEFSSESCTISGNATTPYSGNGAGIAAVVGSATITSTLIADNAAGGYGGGLYIVEVDTTLTDCTIGFNDGEETHGNTSGQDGGGISAFASTAKLESTRINNNSAAGDGGGICADDTDVTVTQCVIGVDTVTATEQPNFADGNGGGICINSGSLTITGTSVEFPDITHVSYNLAGADGGGIYVASAATSLDVTLGNFIENKAGEDKHHGGGIYSEVATTLTDCFFDCNFADFGGNLEIATPTASLEMYGCYVWRGSSWNHCKSMGAGALLSNLSTETPSIITSFVTSTGTIVTTFHQNGVEDYPPDFGGGLAIVGSGDITIEDALCDYNFAAKDGGGIYVGEFTDKSSTLTIVNVSVLQNTAASSGGAAAVTGTSAPVTFSECSMSYNKAIAADGGGVLVTSSSLTIEDDTTISWNTAEAGSGGGVAIQTGLTVTLTSSTIYGNLSKKGGGIDVTGSPTATFTVNLSKCTIAGNDASSGNGGGINVRTTNAKITVDSCTVDNNNVTGNGGGIGIDSATSIKLTHSTLTNNSATNFGGGIFIGATTITGAVSISFTTIGLAATKSASAMPNTAGSGGGIYIGSDDSTTATTVTINTSTIEANTATGTGGGGGITINRAANVLVKNSCIDANVASSTAGFGGGINFPHDVIHDSTSFNIHNCTIYGNTAARGGGIYVDGGSSNSTNLLVYNSTIAANSATADKANSGGGIGFQNVSNTDAINLWSTIVAKNGSDTMTGNSGPDIGGSGNNAVTDNYSLIGNSTNGFSLDSGSSNHNQNDLDPGFDTVGLADNGGYTRTVAISKSGHAFENGDNPLGLTNDQRYGDDPTTLLYGRVSGKAADIGAYEVYVPADD